MALVLAVAACSPTLNWREVRPGNGGLSLLLPCKPDKAEKQVPLGGPPTTLTLLGCDAGNATYAVAVAQLADPSQVALVLAQWQALTLANMNAAPVAGAPASPADAALATQVRPLRVPGASPTPPPVLVLAQGQRADGTRVDGQAAYFSKGAQVIQVVMYAPRIAPEAAETFFSNLKLD